MHGSCCAEEGVTICMAFISIALATYNGEIFIKEQMESILNQSFQDFEVVIHDDCSTDGTYDLLCQFAEKDSRIILKKNEHNLGFSENFKSIVDECTGEYIAFSDQDDIWEIKHLEILLSIIGKKDLACGNALLVDRDNHSLGFTMREVAGIKNEVEPDRICWRLFNDNFVQGAAMLVRRELCENYLPVPDVVKFHDYWLALVASLNNGMIYTPEIILRYRQHGNNVTCNRKNSILREAYNSFNGLTKKHFLRQAEILLCLKNRFKNNPFVAESYKFYNDCYSRNIDKYDQKYFKEHYRDMFLDDSHYLIRKAIYLRSANL